MEERNPSNQKLEQWCCHPLERLTEQKSAEVFTTSAIDCRLPTLILLYWHLRTPKHQSDENFVWPTGRKEGDVAVPMCDYTPYKLVDHIIVLVLSTTVVGVEVDVFLPKAVMMNEIVQPTDNSVGALAAIPSFVG